MWKRHMCICEYIFATLTHSSVIKRFLNDWSSNSNHLINQPENCWHHSGTLCAVISSAHYMLCAVHRYNALYLICMLVWFLLFAVDPGWICNEVCALSVVAKQSPNVFSGDQFTNSVWFTHTRNFLWLFSSKFLCLFMSDTVWICV